MAALLQTDVELVVVETSGDREQHEPIWTLGGKGVFVKEVQAAVLDGRADLAVHSAKDLPSGSIDGLVLAAVPERGDPRDALVGSALVDLPPGARVATGSVRRRAQLADLRPDLTFDGLRGNIPTRLAKADGYDAIVVAAVALERLELSDRIADVLPTSVMVPQVAQGALAVECRSDDDATREALAEIEDRDSRRAVDAERAFLAELGGDCDLPAGAYATTTQGCSSKVCWRPSTAGSSCGIARKGKNRKRSAEPWPGTSSIRPGARPFWHKGRPDGWAPAHSLIWNWSDTYRTDTLWPSRTAGLGAEGNRHRPFRELSEGADPGGQHGCDEMDQSSGNRLIRDRYEAIDVLGRGGQGEVWKALDHQHGRVVALKMRPVADGEHRDRILAEARILLSLRPHPSLPLVREDFFWDDGYVLVMDWVEGTDLGALLLETGDPGLPVSSVLAWLNQAAGGIDHLHAQGVVHGDVKPANLVLTPEGRVVLVGLRDLALP